MATGVVVVHGVGDPEAGYATEALASALEGVDARLRLDGRTESLWLPDLGGHADRFPMLVRRTADGEVFYADVFWGSASRVTEGWTASVLTLFRLLFGFKSIARHAARALEGDPVGRAMGSLAESVAWTLRGPVLAINALLAAGLVPLFLLAGAGPDAAPWAVGVTAGVAVLTPVWGRRLRGAWRLAGIWAVAFGAGWLVHLAMHGLPYTWRDGAQVQIVCLSLVFAGMIAQLIFLLLMWLGSRAGKDDARRAAFDAATFAGAFQVALWGLLVPLLWALVIVWMPEGPREFLVAQLKEAVPLASFQWLVTVVVVLGFVAAWIKRKRAVETAGAAVPRLILHPFALAIALACAMVGSVLFLVVTFSMLLFGSNPLTRVELFDFAGSVAAVGSLPVLALLSGTVRAKLRVGLDVAADVVHYLQVRDTRASTPGPTALAIRHRMRKVMETVLARENPDRIVIVAHSLGSVIAVDELADHAGPCACAFEGTVELVTMGSPVTHLFQHYFPGTYPRDWGDPKWTHFTDRVARWRNVHRRDDFVGTAIAGEDAAPLAGKLTNREIAAGRHTDYWTEPDFVAEVAARLLDGR